MDTLQTGLVVLNLGVTSAMAVYLSRLTSRSEHARWRRQERIESAVALKGAAARLRSQLSKSGRAGGRKPWATDDRDFTEVNTAIARCELTAQDGEMDVLADLRTVFRDFIRAAEAGDQEWREERGKLDVQLSKYLEMVRSGT